MKGEYMSNFEKQVRHALIEKEMKITDLTEALGITTQYLWEIFKGTRKADETRARIRQYLGIEVIENEDDDSEGS
jgi:ribosome-binding protein aMBF1 (putative translation factor)